MHPYQMKPTDIEIKLAITKVIDVQGKVPATTCSHRNECCKAGCPNMYYSEYLRMSSAVKDMPRERRSAIMLDCLRRYLTPQVVDKPKPCLFLKEDGNCEVYSSRPLKCRLYGLIPKDLYRRNVLSVARDMGVEKERVPLCVQCDQVKGNVVPEGKIVEMEKALRQSDLLMGMPKKIQDDGFGFLTFHDWYLISELGTEWLEGLSKIRTELNEEQKEQFLAALKSELDSKLA